jgi:hypothetical protein
MNRDYRLFIKDIMEPEVLLDEEKLKRALYLNA